MPSSRRMTEINYGVSFQLTDSLQETLFIRVSLQYIHHAELGQLSTGEMCGAEQETHPGHSAWVVLACLPTPALFCLTSSWL